MEIVNKNYFGVSEFIYKYMHGAKYRYILDPYSVDDKWVSMTVFNKYLTKNYALTDIQAYNQLHGNDLNFVPKCGNPDCNNLVRFINCIKGFRTACSKSCANKTPLIKEIHSRIFTGMNNKNWSDPDYRNMVSKRSSAVLSKTSSKLWSDPDYRKFKLDTFVHGVESRAKSNRTNFLRLGDPSDECVLYLAVVKWNLSKVKFGVTNMDLKSKSERCGYLSAHKIYKGTRFEVAELEFKLHLSIGSEWFPWNDYRKFKEIFLNLIN